MIKNLEWLVPTKCAQEPLLSPGESHSLHSATSTCSVRFYIMKYEAGNGEK